MMTAITVGALGTDICLKTISLTCSKSIDMITYFATNTHPSFGEFNNLLTRADLAVKINKIRQLINEFKHKEETGFKFQKSIQMSISDVDDAIIKINRILDETKIAKEEHEQKYFNGWRSADCSGQIESLKMSADILESRFNDLVKVLTIHNSIDKHNNSN